MLQGNAIEDYFISVILQNQIPKGFVGRLASGNTFTLQFPDDWYNDFCGFLICMVTRMIVWEINIVIKQEVDEDSLFELCQESNEASELEDVVGTNTYVGYVSFGSLRHTSLSNSSYKTISVSGVSSAAASYVGAELVPRKSRVHQVQTTKVVTDFSEFYDQELNYGRPLFTIQDDSVSSIKIIWKTPTTSRV